MAILKLFSTRQKEFRGEVTDVYQYDEINEKLKIQIIHIIKGTIGNETYIDRTGKKVRTVPGADIYNGIHRDLCKEYGVFSLKKNEYSNYNAVYDYFFDLEPKNIELCLDIIELSFQAIDGFIRSYQRKNSNHYLMSSNEAIKELNYRFKIAGVGYQFESGEIIKIDSQFVHAEVVKPVLQLLGKDKIYSGANNEFLSAHDHYRHKKYKECLVDCLKSFESLMKAIYDKQKWNYKKTDQANKLINVCFAKNLVPSYMQSQFESLNQLFVSGVPVIRNKSAGHGQGTEIIDVPEHLASYTLHLTATNLLFLAKCEMELKER